MEGAQAEEGAFGEEGTLGEEGAIWVSLDRNKWNTFKVT